MVLASIIIILFVYLFTEASDSWRIDGLEEEVVAGLFVSVLPGLCVVLCCVALLGLLAILSLVLHWGCGNSTNSKAIFILLK
jgi:hypothetical protein